MYTLVWPLHPLPHFEIDRWINDLRFYVFLTVFQSYKDDDRLIMKGVCNGTQFTIEKISPRAELEFEDARSVG